MNITEKLSSAPMYLICGGIIAFVALLCVVFMVRAYKAGKAIGMDTAKMKRVIVSSATFSVLERGYSAWRYCAVGQFGHTVAVAAAFGYRCAAL